MNDSEFENRRKNRPRARVMARDSSESQMLKLVFFTALLSILAGTKGDVIYELQSGRRGSGRVTLYPALLNSSTDDQATGLDTTLVPAQETVDSIALEEYTICAAFSVSIFTEVGTIFSYALDKPFKNVLSMAVTPDSFYVTYDYNIIDIPVEQGDALLNTWQRVCLVGVRGKKHTFYLDGQPLRSWLWPFEEPALLSGGGLVLGQDQDKFMGGFSEDRAFVGRLANVNAWSRALTPLEVQVQSTCQKTQLEEGDWVGWTRAPWKPEGKFEVLSGKSCQKTDKDILFFNHQLSLQDARTLLKIMGLELFLPKKQKEANDLEKLMTAYGSQCKYKHSSIKAAWINARYIPDAKQWVNVHTGEKLQFNLDHRKSAQAATEGAVQVGDERWIMENPQNENCFAALKPKPASVFWLRGLQKKSFSGFSRAFVMVNDNGISFRGMKGHLIQYQSNKWQLSKNDKVIARLQGLHFPIGRRIWRQPGSNTTLTLSRCTSNDFTCDDGSCISIIQRCDLVPNCKDRSDEQRCELVQLPPNHINSFLPSRQLSMEVQILLDIIKVDLLDMSLLLDMSVAMSWYDPSVKYKNLREKKYANQIYSSQDNFPVWTPITSIEPVTGFPIQKRLLFVKRESKSTIKQGDLLYNGNKNPLSLKILLQPKVRCIFKLHLFPWDTQYCSFNIELTNLLENGLNLTETSKVGIKNHLGVEGYAIEKLSMAQDQKRVSISLVLKRQSAQYLWDSYLPTVLLLAIGYGTLFLPVEPFNDRGTLSLTTLLVLVALYTDSATSLPTTSYNTFMDTWYIFSMVFLALIVATHLLTSASKNSVQIQAHPLANFDTHVKAWMPQSPKTTNAEVPPQASKTLFYSRIFYAGAFVVYLGVYVYWIIVQ